MDENEMRKLVQLNCVYCHRAVQTECLANIKALHLSTPCGCYLYPKRVFPMVIGEFGPD